MPQPRAFDGGRANTTGSRPAVSRNVQPNREVPALARRFSDAARRLALITACEVAIDPRFVPDNRLSVAHRIFTNQGFSFVSDILLVGENRLSKLDGLGRKTLDGIALSLVEIDESFELHPDPGPAYAALLCETVEQVPIQVLTPELHEQRDNTARRITVADVLDPASRTGLMLPDGVLQAAREYGALFTAAQEALQ